MRALLIALFTAILLTMLYVTITASLERSVFANGHLMQDRWFVATLVDAYCGFITFYVWVAWKEPNLFGKVLWFVLIMGLGNIAISAYMLLQLKKLKPGEPLSRLLLRDA